MIIVKLMGGLGNQMFQYAAGRYLADKHQTTLKLDLSFLQDSSPLEGFTHRDYQLNIFKVQENFTKSGDYIIAGRRYQRLRRGLYHLQRYFRSDLPVHLLQTTYYFDKRLLQAADNVYLEGYWQSEKHFLPAETTIRQDFTFKNPVSQHNMPLVEQIQAKPAICLHVRRSDFLNFPQHQVCTLSYYQRGISYLAERVVEGEVFVFSDDITWCQQNLTGNVPLNFVSDTTRSVEDDLRAMTHCKHFIISNSSFSWWGAWLAKNPDKIVVTPDRWANNKRDNQDIIPSTWTKLPV